MQHPEIQRPQAAQGRQLLRRELRPGRGVVPRALPRAPPRTRPPGSSTPAATTCSIPWPPNGSRGTCREVKLIAMVRDPVERAWSAYKHELARGFEWEQSFGRALELEDDRLAGEVERMIADPGYQSFNHRHHAYRGRGEYARLLQPFVDGLGRDRLLVVESESFFARARGGVRPDRRLPGRAALRPGQLRPLQRPAGKPRGRRPGRGCPTHFEEHDAALAALIGHVPVWRRRDG